MRHTEKKRNEYLINLLFRENAAEDERCLAMAEDIIVKSRTEEPVITGKSMVSISFCFSEHRAHE